ncbi:MAG: hypothetical protein KF726_11950, partial [Anaerolineae bacterium]|nr:hypothetical protein [Anaerolineae bacterium]
MIRFRGSVGVLVIVLTVALLNVPSITPTRAQGGETPLAPQGENGKTYYAPFPVKITVDGDLADWAGVPTVTVKASSGDAAVTFAAAADD